MVLRPLHVLALLAVTGCGPHPEPVNHASARNIADPAAPTAETTARRRMAITVDDLPFAGVTDELEVWARTQRALLGCFEAHGVPAVGFVNESKLAASPDAPPEPARAALLRGWLDAGLELGNHTYAHRDLHEIGPAAFIEEIDRGDGVLATLAEETGRPLRWFRHPFLHTGRDAESRGAVDAFLHAHHYQVAPVTIDDQDWMYARAYDRADDPDDRTRFADDYVRYMDAIIAYYESQSLALLGREIPQVLLIHQNRLNAVTCERLLTAIEARGYRFVTLEAATSDPAFDREDRYFGPGGISWIHRWALTEGRRGAFFGDEPAPPEEIVRLAESD